MKHKLLFFLLILIILLCLRKKTETFNSSKNKNNSSSSNKYTPNWGQCSTPVPGWSKCTTNPPDGEKNPKNAYPPAGSSELWCGGDTIPINQITCSPFNYRPKMFIHNNNCGIDPSNFYDTIMSNSGETQQDKNKNCNWISTQGARVWGHFDSSGNLTTDEYFVFHGCDSAGVQPDCWGDIKYIERFGKKIGTGAKSISDYKGGPYCKTATSQQDKDVNDRRCYYTFVHPGTLTQYHNYAGGWWFNGNIEESDFNSHATGNWKSFTYDTFTSLFDEYIKKYQDKDKNFSFMLYPWTCVNTNEFGNVNYFSYPHITDNNYKCYVDNEPGNNKTGAGRPLFIEFYFGYLDYNDNSATWRITYTPVTMDENFKIIHYKENYLFPLCHTDGSPW